MKCGICGSEGAKPYLLQSGRDIGPACERDLCGALLWESRVHIDESDHERRFRDWRIRQHRAAVLGRPFTEPAPKSPAEKQLERFDELKRIAALEGDADAVPGL